MGGRTAVRLVGGLVTTLAVTLAIAACGSEPAATSPEGPGEEATTAQEAAAPQEEAGQEPTPQEDQEDERQNNATESETTMRRATITVNGTSFDAELENSDCGRAFADLLPLKLSMQELNGNEKYCYTGTALPSSPQNPGRIEAGDLMLYGSDCVVLFYEGFGTSYSYTRIGRIPDPEGIADAVGAGTATVAFELGA